MSEPQPRLFDIDGAVKYFHEIGAAGVTRNFVRELIASGGIPHLKLSRKFYISRTAIDEWLAKHERRAR
jgi:excisionase family DNA binding protein